MFEQSLNIIFFLAFLPQKQEADDLKFFRLISLVRGMRKIISPFS